MNPPDRALRGRERELGVIEELLARAGDRGGALVVRGEVGVGKSALLEDAHWSPDSKRIAFARFDYGQEQTGGVTRMSLHVVGADGRHARRLTY